MGKVVNQTEVMKKAYKEISIKRKKHGKYMKCLFHIHTPASYDFKLLDDKTDDWYRNLSEEEIYDVASDKLGFLKDFRYKQELIESKGYSTAKEYLSYLMQAAEIVKNEIEIVLVCDHNTTEGVQKLEKAIESYCKSKRISNIPEVLLGIEINCADLFHVVGIFEKKEMEEINKSLSEIIMSPKDGTYETSKRVIEKITEIGGIAYIAHINSSNSLKEGALSGGYKKELFRSNNLKILGVNKSEEIPKQIERISQYTSKKFSYVLDNDTHGIYNFEENHFWIKGQKKDFSIMKNIIIDSNISLEYEKPKKPKSYIKGMYIESGKDSFLKGKNNNIFCVNFSESMNCFIGGRGTGKSTIINIIDFMSGKEKTPKEYNLIAKYESIWLLCQCDDEEYFVRFLSPDLEGSANLIEFAEKKYTNDYTENKIASIKKIMKESIRIYKILPDEKIEELSIREEADIRNKIFSKTYSVNTLVEKINRNEINEYIKDTILKNDLINKKVEFKQNKKIKNQLEKVKKENEKKESEISTIINDFNDKQKNKLKIVTNVKELEYEQVKEMLNLNNNNGYFENVNISNDAIVSYVYQIIKKIGVFNFLNILYNNAQNLNDIIPILDYTMEYTRKEVENGITEITKDNKNIIFEKILMKFEKTEKNVISVLNNYLRKYNEYNLEFNINSKTMKRGTKTIFKDITELSMGQKVVAIMSFVLAYSDYSSDYTPFIVDQPEDNLDNMYIYENLVEQFKSIKNKRQVIIATHNSTIVTNSKAEEVIVMESNNKNGWIADYGYPTDDRIKKHLLICLEGGIKSFIHKMNIYEEQLRNNDE